MPLYDITQPIEGSMAVWPGDPPVRILRERQVANGDTSTVSRLEMGLHTGTHVDAPCHFFPGANGVESLGLDVLVGPAQVVDVRGAERITAKVLSGAGMTGKIDRILLRTAASRRKPGAFDKRFAALSEDGARLLVERTVRLVGIDTPSVAPYEDSAPVHRMLLENGVVILEGLVLDAVAPGSYRLVCLPLKIPGADGAPARVILMTGRPSAP